MIVYPKSLVVSRKCSQIPCGLYPTCLLTKLQVYIADEVMSDDLIIVPIRIIRGREYEDGVRASIESLRVVRLHDTR